MNTNETYEVEIVKDNIEINENEFTICDNNLTNNEQEMEIINNDTKDKKVIDKSKSETSEMTKEVALESIITHVIKVPGVKVDRDEFLSNIFKKEVDDIQVVIDKGPVDAGIDEKKLRKIAEKLILTRTSESSLASFAMGIPGGLAIAATIPSDIFQFYAMTLRLAQELTYIYGATDLWKDGQVDEEKIRNQLILYCGVLFGVSGASAGVRLLSTQIAKTTLKKLPQKALTKTFWYPIIQQIGKSIGIKVTKKSIAGCFHKVIPVVGGFIAGTMTFFSMKPMATRLLNTLEEANFNYTEEDFFNDIEIVDAIDENDILKIEEFEYKDKKQSLILKGKEKVGNLFKKKDKKICEGTEVQSTVVIVEDEYEKVKKLKELLDIGAITQEEFDSKKKELLGL